MLMWRFGPNGAKPPCTSRAWLSTTTEPGAISSMDFDIAAQSWPRQLISFPPAGAGKTLKWPREAVVTSFPGMTEKSRDPGCFAAAA